MDEFKTRYILQGGDVFLVYLVLCPEARKSGSLVLELIE